MSCDEVEKLINSAPNKMYQLDPATPWLMKDTSGLLSTSQLSLLSTVSFRAEFKETVVRPLLQKEGLDAGELKNFSPVSNL